MPALVATLTVPPAFTPFCAFWELVSTRNSCIASGKRQRQVDAVVPVVVHRAVEQILHAELLAAGDRDAAALCQAAARRIAGVHRTASQDDERGDVATLERQRLDGLVVDDCSDRRVARFDERRGRLHRHCFLERAELQLHGDHRIAVHLQHDSGLHVGAEAGERGFEAIRSNRQVGQRVRARDVGDGIPAKAGVRLDCGDRDTRQRSATFVNDGPVDLCCGLGRLHRAKPGNNRTSAATRVRRVRSIKASTSEPGVIVNRKQWTAAGRRHRYYTRRPVCGIASCRIVTAPEWRMATTCRVWYTVRHDEQ